jgi:hypothetical protein
MPIRSWIVLFYGALALAGCSSDPERPAAVAPAPAPKAGAAPASAPEPPIPAPYRFEVLGPARAWKEPDGRWFVRFRWQLRFEGEGEELLSSSNQALYLKTEAGELWPSIHPDTLVLTKGQARSFDAMFYQNTAGAEPKSLEARLLLRGQEVGRQALEKEVVPITGLSFSLGASAQLGSYEGRPHEPSATTLTVEVTVKNPTQNPVRFAPFDLTGESGGLRWSYHHEGSHHSILLLEPGQEIRVRQVLAESPRARPGPELEVRYRGASLGKVPIIP